MFCSRLQLQWKGSVCGWPTRIKEAGIAIRHLRGRILFYTAGSRNGLAGLDTTPWLALTKRKLSLGKRYFFVIEKYVEDVKQEEKDVPDLLESIMRPTCLVKEELRTNSCKSNGLQTRLKQKHIFHPSSQAPAWPGPGPLRRRMENLKKERPNIKKNQRKIMVLAPLGLVILVAK